MIKKYQDLIRVKSPSNLIRQDTEFLEQVWKLFGEYVFNLEKMKIREALRLVMEVSSLANKYVQDNKIWDKGIDRQLLMNKLVILANTIRFVALMWVY